MASDSDSDEDFVTYGTPLEPLEEDEPLRKPVPIHEQTVKDEKGRYKRFHGAFTGGFSAGYFNSVGTKEGWAPSTFTSSRAQKAEKGRARPEDFMDEEDFSEHGIAPSEISRTEEFGSGRRDQLQEKARLISSLSATIPGDTLLKELIAPARTSIGVELLRKMGWKDGQGVGPRMKRKKGKQKTESSGHRIYGCAPPRAGSEGSEEEEEDDDEFAPENVTFAPKDVTPIDFTPKENVHGLGYSGLNPLKALLGSSGSASGHINLFSLDSDRTTQLFGQQGGGAHRSRKGPTGQAFGVGAMEDDDEDVYHRDSMSNYDRVLGGKEAGDGLYGWTAPQQYKKNKTIMSVEASYLGKILEGFTLSSQAVDQKTIFPPPDLPRDYRPVHHFRPVFNVSGVSPALAQALQASKGQLTPDVSGPQPGRHTLDSAQRGQLLGETALQGPSSIFELLSSEDRQKLASLQSTSRPPAASAPPSSSSSSHDAMAPAGVEAAKLTAQRAMVSAGVEAAKLTAQRAMSSRFQPQRTQQQQQEEQALSAWKAPTAQGAQTFKPFEANASKQARYDLYLSKLKQGDRDSLDLCLDTNMTEWERSRERDEFVRAAVLYKPASSFLSSRFTRGKREDNDDTIEVNKEQENDVDDKQAAVKMKMFGQLTRDTFEWHPDTLLCKRFNVPDPFPGSGLVGMPKVKRDKFSVFNFLNVAESPTATASQHTFALPKPVEASRRSRWDKEEKHKDPLSEFISVARNTASGPQPDQSTSTNPPSTTTGTAAGPLTTDVKVETKSPEHPDREKKKSADEEDAAGEEEEEEETRPPMDLFKAIFDSSSDDKSSSSEDEEDDVDTGRGASEVSSLFNTVPAVSTPQTETALTQLTVLPPAGQTVPAVASPSQNMKQEDEEEEEEFGPKLPPPSSAPPPSSVPAGEGMSSLTPLTKEEVKHSRRSNKEKHKNKKQHKHKKDKKKNKKHKKHKHKAKQKKKDTSDSSSEDSEADGQGSPTTDDTDPLQTELLKRLKTIRSQQQW